MWVWRRGRFEVYFPEGMKGCVCIQRGLLRTALISVWCLRGSDHLERSFRKGRMFWPYRVSLFVAGVDPIFAKRWEEGRIGEESILRRRIGGTLPRRFCIFLPYRELFTFLIYLVKCLYIPLKITLIIIWPVNFTNLGVKEVASVNYWLPWQCDIYVIPVCRKKYIRWNDLNHRG